MHNGGRQNAPPTPYLKSGSRTLWVVLAIVGMQFWGPILYFLLGKED